MLVTRTSVVSGVTRTRDLDVTQEQLDRWEAGELVHRVFPHLDDSDREFLMTGMTDEEWDAIFPPE